MLSISEFSQMCHLSPQVLRFYHAEGLLVPAATDERTGYRSYEFKQVERAMMVALLRDTGMSVKAVREALDDPDRAPLLLDRHRDEVRRQRTVQDDALDAARAMFGPQPEPRRRRVPARTVVSAPVPGTPPGRDAEEWDEAERMIEAAAAELVAAVEAAGAERVGRPWRTLSRNPGVLDGEGQLWLVNVAVAEAPAGLTARTEAAREELTVFMPGRNTMAKYCTMILRLLDALPADGDVFLDVSRVWQEVREDGVLSGAPIGMPPAGER